MSNAPDCVLDFRSDDFIQDLWPRCAKMRALGPVLRMTRLGNFAFTQLDMMRAGLRDAATCQSGEDAAGDAFAFALGPARPPLP